MAIAVGGLLGCAVGSTVGVVVVLGLMVTRYVRPQSTDLIFVIIYVCSPLGMVAGLLIGNAISKRKRKS